MEGNICLVPTTAVLKPGQVNPHIQVKWSLFLGVTWITISSHRKPDNQFMFLKIAIIGLVIVGSE